MNSAQTPKPKMSTGKKILIGVGILIGIGIIGAAMDDGKANKEIASAPAENKTSEAPAQDAQAAQEEIKKNTITANQLVDAYEANEVSADNQYKDKTVYVSGKVGDIAKDVLDNIYIILKTGDMEVNNVQCYFDDADAAAKLTKGSKITLKGTCKGKVILNVVVEDCELVQ
jgi:6-phosphogluconate dehydrogenase (decarboxylating)